MQLPQTRLKSTGNCAPVTALRFLAPLVALLAFSALAAFPSLAQSKSWQVRIAGAIIENHSLQTPAAAAWDEETGARLAGLDAAWYNTANGDYFRSVKQTVDSYLASNEADETGKHPATPLANALLGRQLLLLYRVTLDAKYYQASSAFEARLASSCGVTTAATATIAATHEPFPGPCVAEPFLAEYASVFQQPGNFAAITRDFLRWDAAGNRASAPRASQPSSAQARQLSNAWLAVALVDALPYYSAKDPGRAQLITMLHRIAAAIVRHQDAETGMLYALQSEPAAARQPLSPTAVALYVYALAKGVRSDFLPVSYSRDAARAWRCALNRFVHVDANGAVSIADVSPGSRASEDGPRHRATAATASSPLRGAGAFLLAATEMDLAPASTAGRGSTVMLDAWYNSQQRKNAAGQVESFHYKWSDQSDSGYSLFGHLLRSYGLSTGTLYSAPTRENLRGAQFYIIVSPDIPAKNPNPHYMTAQDADEIAAWVKEGGVLVMMENDPPNADIAHLDLLADRFGIHFDDVLHHHILGEHVEDGRIPVAAGGDLFHRPHILYMKDTCAISLHGSAQALLRDRGDVVMAAARFGRGTVFAAVDPWLYNEYTDGRKNPLIYSQFDNFAAARELVQWLLLQRPQPSAALPPR